jgi:MFS family permease
MTFLALGVVIQQNLGFWYVAVLWAANSIFGAVYFPALQALVSDILPKEKRLDGHAVTRAAGNLGWAVGPAIGGFLAHSSYAVLFYLAAVVLFASGLIFWSAFRPPAQAKRLEAFKLSDLVAIRHDPRMAIYCFLSFLLFLVVAQLIVPFSVYAKDFAGVNEYYLGWIYAVNGFLVGVVQIPVTRLLARYRFTTQLAAGAMLYFVGYGLIGLSGNYWFLMMMIIISTCGEVTMSPASMTLTSRLAPDRQMGRYMGIYGFFMAGGWSLGPLYGNWILDSLSDKPELAWLLIASLALVAAVGFVWFGRRLPDEFNCQEKPI